MLATVRQTLINFVGDPNASWGQPTNGSNNPTSINAGSVARVQVMQSDRNTARINSGTYIEKQYADFERQWAQIERGGSGTAYFPGDPNDLPVTVPERTCTRCTKSFRSVNTDAVVRCYDCALDQLCPQLPGRHMQCFWDRDNWRMELFGDVGLSNKLTFWWSNRNSGGTVCHQGLEVQRSPEGAIRQLTLATVAERAHRCYRVVWDIESGAAPRYYVYNRASVSMDGYGRLTEVEAFDDIVLDLIVAMLPDWMLFTHRPRNPANGCFATA